MPDLNLDDARRDYTFRLEQAPRCETCRHARPGRSTIHTYEATCLLLSIEIANVTKSKCPAWQSGWGRSDD